MNLELARRVLGVVVAVQMMLIGFRLVHVIGWAWIWVLAPELIAFALLDIYLLIIGARVLSQLAARRYTRS